MKYNVVYPQSSGTNVFVGYYRHTSGVIYFVEIVDFCYVHFLWWSIDPGKSCDLNYSPDIVVTNSASYNGFLRSINSAFRKFVGRYLFDRCTFVNLK